MYCPHCGRPFGEGERFCPNCGPDQASGHPAASPAAQRPMPAPQPAPQPQPAPALAPEAGGAKYCTRCGAPNGKEKNFCVKCGTPFQRASAPAPSSTPPLPTPATFSANPAVNPLEGCVSAAWRDVRSTQGWVRKSLLLGLMGLVPVLSWAVPGYALRWGAEVPRGKRNPMPQSVFADRPFAAGARLTLIGLIVVAVGYLVWALVNSAVNPHGGFYYLAYVRAWWPVAIGLIIVTTLAAGPDAAPVGVSVLFSALLFFIPAPLSSLVSLVVALFGTAFIYVCYLRATLLDRVGAAFQLDKCGRAYGKGLGKLLVIVLVPSLLTGLVALAFVLVIGVLLFAFGAGTISSYGGSYAYSSSSLFSVVSQVSIGVVVALLLMGYVYAVCNAVAQLVSYRAMGHWVARMAPEWAAEAPASAAAFGGGAPAGQTFPTYTPPVGKPVATASPAMPPVGGPVAGAASGGAPAGGMAAPTGAPVAGIAAPSSQPVGGVAPSGSAASGGVVAASVGSASETSAPNDRETSILAAEPAGARVTVLLVRADGRRYRVSNFPSTVGKGTAAAVCIDGNDAISRVHARISYVDGTPAVEDLGSKNGTYLNGNVLAQGELVKLRTGDQLRLGNETFSVDVQ